jgi:hypothetical protein
MLVELHYTAHHAMIVMEVAVPIRIPEHDIGSAVGTVLIGAMKEAAEGRPYA